MDFSKLKQLNDKNTGEALEKKRHSEILLDNTATQEVIVKSISALKEFLDNKVTKTEVVNQLREIRTPDTEKVVTALASLHDTLKQHKNTDLTKITEVMQGVLDEVKQLPKENPELPEQKFVDYSKQLTQLEKTLQTIEKAIKAQDLKVEAPIVNVPETVVNVDAPDLKPIEKSVSDGSKDVVKAVKGIKIPELNTDPVEKLLKKTNKLLEELPELMPSGGSSSGLGWIATNADGTPVPIELDANGSIPVSTSTTDEATRIAVKSDDADIYYIAKAPIGTADSASSWKIKRLDSNTIDLDVRWADSGNYTQVWNNRESLSYS